MTSIVIGGVHETCNQRVADYVSFLRRGRYEMEEQLRDIRKALLHAKPECLGVGGEGCGNGTTSWYIRDEIADDIRRVLGD